VKEVTFKLFQIITTTCIPSAKTERNVRCHHSRSLKRLFKKQMLYLLQSSEQSYLSALSHPTKVI